MVAWRRGIEGVGEKFHGRCGSCSRSPNISTSQHVEVQYCSSRNVCPFFPGPLVAVNFTAFDLAAYM